MKQGIDYGNGLVNCDTEYRFGVICSHGISDAWNEESEADYGTPYCPTCGGTLHDGEDKDFTCDDCGQSYWSDEVFGEPLGWFVENDEYEAIGHDDCDVTVMKSPYYTYAPFCSPCVPGACDLDSVSVHDGESDDEFEARMLREGYVPCYCFGNDWFPSEKAPYPVFKVKK